jgi:hypothetical protein
MAHVPALERLKEYQDLPFAFTFTGTWLSVVVPTPSCPFVFLPQHQSSLRLFFAQACTAPTSTATQLFAVPTCFGPTAVPAAGSPLVASHVTPLVPSALPQHQMVPFLASAHVVPEPGELMLSHLAGRLGIDVAALAGAAESRTGSPPARSAIVARKVEMTFDLRMLCFLCFLLLGDWNFYNDRI